MYKATLTTAAVTGCTNRLLSDKAAVLWDSIKGTFYIQVCDLGYLQELTLGTLP